MLDFRRVAGSNLSNKVKLAFTRTCSRGVQDKVEELASRISWIQSDPSQEAPPKPEYSPEVDRHYQHLIQDITNLLLAEGLKFIIAAGALLGIARHGNLIPWDYKDIDLILFDDDGYSKYRFLQALTKQGFFTNCLGSDGFIIQIYREDVISCTEDPELSPWPYIDVFTAMPLPANQAVYMVRSQPDFLVPRSVVQPLRLVYINDGLDEESMILSFRPASDALLDCSPAFGNINQDGTPARSWRQKCYRRARGNASSVDTKCSDLRDEVAFVKRDMLTFGEFIKRYIPGAEDYVPLGVPASTKIHLTWQYFQGRVAHFWLDFGTSDCAALLSAPRLAPRAAIRVSSGGFPWQMEDDECSFTGVPS